MNTTLLLQLIVNGVIVGALYGVVAMCFVLIYKASQVVNFAQGEFVLIGAWACWWLVTSLNLPFWIGFPVCLVFMCLLGVLVQVVVLRPLIGEPVISIVMVTIGLSIVFADLMLWAFGGDFYQIQTPNWLVGPIQLPLITAVKSSGDPVYLQYPLVRLVIFVASVVIGVAMWLALNRTRVGMIVRAGVDDRDILAATGVRIQLVFVLVFALGAGLAGIAGVVGGTFQSISPGEDTRFLLASLVVVIVGGMGSIPGAALGAVIIGLAEQLGSVYIPTYAIVVTFLIMVLVLALRPQGLLARR